MFWWVGRSPVMLTPDELNDLLGGEGIEGPHLRAVGDQQSAAAEMRIKEKITDLVRRGDDNGLKYVFRDVRDAEAGNLLPHMIGGHGKATGITACQVWTTEQAHDWPGEATGNVDEISVGVFGQETAQQVIKRLRSGKQSITRRLHVLQGTNWPGKRSMLPSRVMLHTFQIRRSCVIAIRGTVERFELFSADEIFEFRPASVVRRFVAAQR